jgi:tetratricopeptide (TPR) repeat protein
VEQTLEHIKDLIYFLKLIEAQQEINKINRGDLSTKETLDLEILELEFLNFRIGMGITNFEGKLIDIGNTALQLLEKSNKYGTTIQKIDAFSAYFNGLRNQNIVPVTRKELFKDHFIKVQLLLSDINDKNGILIRKSLGQLFRSIGLCFLAIENNYKDALDYFKKSINSSQTIDLNMEALSLNGIGHVFMITGELNAALEYFEKSLEIFNKLNAPMVIMDLTSVAIVNALKGNPSLALRGFEEAIEYSKNFDPKEPWIILRNLINKTNMGENLVLRGDVEEGLEIFKQQLPILAQLNAYLEEMKSTYKSNNSQRYSQLNSQRYRIAKGILFKDSDRLQNIVQAQQLFREVAEEPRVWFEYTIQAMMNLGESLLNEFKITQSETVLKEYTELIQRLLTLAKEEKSFWILIEAYLLKAKLELINFNFKGFEELLMQARLTAEEKGLDGFLSRIEEEKKSFEEQVDNWNKLLGNNASYYDRIKQANLIEYMKEAKKIHI